MTCRRDHLPNSVPRKYFNFIKAAQVNARSKVAQFENIIVAVKHVKHQDSDTVNDKMDNSHSHVSFQSTGGTNISTVNALFSVIYMCEIAVRAGDSRRGHGGLK